jgi:hypothetical protein
MRSIEGGKEAPGNLKFLPIVDSQLDSSVADNSIRLATA